MFEKVKGFLLDPSKTFEASKKEMFIEVMKYYGGIALIFSIILISVIRLTRDEALISYFVGVFALWFYWIILLHIGGIIIHMALYLIGVREGIEQTIKVIMYGLTPAVLFGWIIIFYQQEVWTKIFYQQVINKPELLLDWKIILTVIGWVWSTVLIIIGLHSLHKIPKRKAIVIGTIIIILTISISTYSLDAFLSAVPNM